MDLLQWIKNRWQAPAVTYTYLWIDPGQARLKGGAVLDPTPVEAGHRYFRVWLAQMALKNDRDWGTSWYPAVLSVINFQFGNQSQQISHIAGETALKDFDLGHLNRSIALNYPLTALVPFNGGSVELEAGLVAMEGKSDLKGMLKVLGDFSKLMIVPQLSAALAVATPLADGIAEFLGASGARPELRMHDTWTGLNAGGPNLLRAGYLLVLGAPAGTIPLEQLWVDQDQVLRGTSWETAQPLGGYHYMLLRIDTTEVRDDWDMLSVIAEPFDQAVGFLQTALGSSDETAQKLRDEAEKRFAAALAAAYRSNDLTKVVGRNQALDGLRKKFADAKQQFGAGAFREDFSTRLSDAVDRAMSPAEAAALGERHEDELWASDE
jgi:hypothetical protein